MSDSFETGRGFSLQVRRQLGRTILVAPDEWLVFLPDELEEMKSIFRVVQFLAMYDEPPGDVYDFDRNLCYVVRRALIRPN